MSRMRVTRPWGSVFTMIGTEFLGRGKATECANVDLVGPTSVAEHGRLVKSASRNLSVLSPQDGQDVAGADVARGRLVRIDPDAHRVLPFAQDPEVGHARQTRDLILDIQDHVIGDVFRAPGSVW